MASLDPHHCSLGLAETPYNVRVAMITSKDSPRHENDKMGQKQSGLTPKKIACLSKETHFSQNEIITWYQGMI